MRFLRCILFILFSVLCYKAFSQTAGNRNVSVTLPVIALLDIEPVGNINFNFTAPSDAGRSIINPAINTSKWINYTSAIPGGLSRRVVASVNQTILGVDIKLQAANASGSGGGTQGTSTGQITLTSTPTTILTGIGGAFTGNGINNGHRITITLTPNNYFNLSAHNNTPVVITYTITE